MKVWRGYYYPKIDDINKVIVVLNNLIKSFDK